MSANDTPLLDAMLNIKQVFIFPDWPKPEFEKWGRGRPNKEKKAKRELLNKWMSEIKIKYQPRIESK